MNGSRADRGNYGLLRPVNQNLRLAAATAETTEAAAVGQNKLADHQLEALFMHLPLTQPISLGAAVLLVLLFWGKTPLVPLVGWFLAVTAVIAARYFGLVVAGELRREHPERWLRLFTTTLVLLGIAWGSLIFVLPRDAMVETTFAALILCMLAAGVVGAYAIRPSAFIAYAVPSILPMAVFLVLKGGAIFVATGGSLLLFLAFMILSVKRTHAKLLTNIGMQEEKERLIRELDSEKQYVEELNEILRADILERERTENELRRSKDAAETLAEKLTLLSSLDGLTEIANRRHFDEALQSEWSRASRAATPVSLILVDIDYFKRYNDHYGHQAGDECLRAIARVLKNFCRRGGDMAARYGGEEFAMLLPNTELHHAAAFAERIRANIEGLGLPHDASQVSKVVTASFGVATLTPQREVRAELLVLTADRALYRAKAAGRNNVKTSLPVEAVDARSRFRDA